MMSGPQFHNAGFPLSAQYDPGAPLAYGLGHHAMASPSAAAASAAAARSPAQQHRERQHQHQHQAQQAQAQAHAHPRQLQHPRVTAAQAQAKAQAAAAAGGAPRMFGGMGPVITVPTASGNGQYMTATVPRHPAPSRGRSSRPPTRQGTWVSPYRSAEENNRYFLYQYKCTPCPLRRSCPNKVTCVGWHHEGEKRRVPVFGAQHTYSEEPCPSVRGPGSSKWLPSSRCPRADSCEYSHTLLEQMYHPHIYKTSMCINFTHPAGNRCQWGYYCTHAHGPEDIRQSPKKAGQHQPNSPGRGQAQSAKPQAETVANAAGAPPNHAPAPSAPLGLDPGTPKRPTAVPRQLSTNSTNREIDPETETESEPVSPVKAPRQVPEDPLSLGMMMLGMDHLHMASSFGQFDDDALGDAEVEQVKGPKPVIDNSCSRPEGLMSTPEPPAALLALHPQYAAPAVLPEEALGRVGHRPLLE